MSSVGEMEIAVVVLGFLVLVLTVALLWVVLRRNTDPIVESTVKTELQAMSQAALAQASEQFLTLAEERLAREGEAHTQELAAKKQLIDRELLSVSGSLEKVTSLIQGIEKDREAKFGALTEQLKTIGSQTQALTASTNTLGEALSNTQVRGQWGERMADDILRLIGFVEGVNYFRQKTLEGVGSRPDFVFLLPGDLKLNMDVKFPLDNYLRCLAAKSEGERDRYKNSFVRDVRSHIKSVTTREYIDPEGGTVDYVVLFIPNTSVYSFIHEHDRDVIDVALSSRVICCSPFTLFAVLSVVRQAVDSFALQKASEEIVGLFGRFNVEWDKFLASLETLGNRIGSAQRSYDELVGPNKRSLERPLRQIDHLRKERGLPVAPLAEHGAWPDGGELSPALGEGEAH